RRVVREWLVVYARGVVLDGAEAVGVAAGDDLLDDQLGRIEVLRLRQHLRHLAAVLLARDVQAGRDDGAIKRHAGGGVLPDPAFRRRDRAARVTVPDLLRDEMDEAGAFEHRTLAAGLATEEAVDAADTQARHVFGGRHDAVFHVGVGIEAGRRDVVAKLQGLV